MTMLACVFKVAVFICIYKLDLTAYKFAKKCMFLQFFFFFTLFDVFGKVAKTAQKRLLGKQWPGTRVQKAAFRKQGPWEAQEASKRPPGNYVQGWLSMLRK